MKQTTLRTGWQLTGGPLKAPIPAQVPGHVHLDLIASGIIGDPFFRQQETGCQWVDSESWTYTLEFNFSGSKHLPHRTLIFEGVDTVAEIVLNGAVIGHTNNMFVTEAFPVNESIQEGDNRLEVRIVAPVPEGNKRRKEFFAKEGLAETTANFTEAAFLRKAQYMSGWDWGPRLVSAGIWKPVHVVETDAPYTYAQSEAAEPWASLVRQPKGNRETFVFQDAHGEIWARGANWIPDDSFPSRITRESLRERLTQAKDLGMNMLRVWGGGLYESDDFYEICLELGIMVWQDFCFACSYYPDDEAFLQEVEREARQAILRLRKFPNLVLWCGNNENHSMFFDKWGGSENNPTRHIGVKIYEELLPRLVAELDPKRSYIPSSPIGGENPNDELIGDQHNWFAWHWKGDWRFYAESKTNFCSEFGFASSPSMATWDKTVLPSENTPRDQTVVWHDKTRKGTETFIGFVELHYPKANNLHDWWYTSQLNQRDAMQFAVEHYRRSDFCKGTLIWQLNDCWPVQSWALIDSSGHYKAVSYALKRLYADLMVAIERQNDIMIVHGINDSKAALQFSVSFQAVDTMTGEVRKNGSHTAELKAGERKPIFEIDLNGLPVPQTAILVDLNQHRRMALLDEPKNTRLAPPEDLSFHLEGDHLVLTTAAPIFDLILTENGNPNPFTDNVLTLMPGTHTIRVNRVPESIEGRSLNGIHRINYRRQGK